MRGRSSTLEILRDVLSATPEPPTDADPTDLVTAAQQMADAREAPLERMQQHLGDDRQLAADCAPLLDEIRERDARWNAALGQARGELSRRAAAVRRLRHKGY